MTDQTPTPFSDDDLSASVDGVAGDHIQARIAADDDATARVAELAVVSERLRATSVPPLDDDTVDELIATALDTPLAPAAPKARRSGPAPWLVAASVIVLMAIGLTLMWAGRGAQIDRASSSDSTFDTVGSSINAEGSAERAADGSFSHGDSTASGSAAPQSQSSRTANEVAAAEDGAGPFYLGSFATAAKLRAALAVSFAKAAEAEGWTAGYDKAMDAAPASAEIDRCGRFLQATLSTKGDPIQRGYAEVDGKPVLVYEFATTSAIDEQETTLVAAVGPEACEQVVIFER